MAFLRVAIGGYRTYGNQCEPLGDRVDLRADRYGHPQGVNLTTLMPGSYDHVVAEYASY
jgi:hypothetical protein